MDLEPEQIAAVRRFSRFYTTQIALLNEGLLDSPFPLTEARVLYELAQRSGTSAAALGRDLRIDAGYLSRILKSFESRGLIARAPSSSDGRQADLSLTAAGRDAFAPLDRASAAQVAGLLAPLAPEVRRDLTAAMATIEALLAPGRVDEPVRFRDLQHGDIGWIAHRHGVLYAAELGWDSTIEALAAEIGAAFLRERDPACERAWIAERGGAILGSVFLVRHTDAVAKLRLLYVEPEARGLGLGRQLVEACIAFARRAGYRELTLWTNDVLRAAGRIYKAAGFRLVEETPHRDFGPAMVGQSWTLPL